MVPSPSRVSGVVLHAETHGRGGPLVLLHGFGANTYSWRHLVGPLGERHEVIAVDLKGCGASPKPDDGAYGILDQARLVTDLLVKRGLTDVTLIGHSLGGGVALAVTLELLAVGRPRIARLVLIDSIAYDQRFPWFIQVLRTPGLGELAISVTPPRLQVRMVLRYAFYDSRAITDDVVTAYAAPLRHRDARRALVTTARQLVPPDMDAFTRRYPEIDIPVLLVWGRHDRVVPLRLGERLAGALPRAELSVVEACGHVPHEERPRDTLEIVDGFFRRHPLST